MSAQWTVPVHGTGSNRTCHKEMQRWCGNLTLTLLRIRDGEVGIESAQALAKNMHDFGSRSSSLLVKFALLPVMLSKGKNYLPEIGQNVMHIHATAQSLSWSSRITSMRNHFIRPAEAVHSENEVERDLINRFLMNQQIFLMDMAKHALRNGDERMCFELMDKIRLDYQSCDERAHYFRTWSGLASHSLRADDNFVREARAVAEESARMSTSDFTKLTGTMVAAELDYKFSDVLRSDPRSAFHHLLSVERLPWGYRRYVKFFVALEEFPDLVLSKVAERRESFYNALIEAQYITSMLGLAVISRPTGRSGFLGIKMDRAQPRDYLHREILETIGIRGPEHTTALRKIHLPKVRNELLIAIYGDPLMAF